MLVTSLVEQIVRKSLLAQNLWFFLVRSLSRKGICANKHDMCNSLLCIYHYLVYYTIRLLYDKLMYYTIWLLYFTIRLLILVSKVISNNSKVISIVYYKITICVSNVGKVINNRIRKLYYIIYTSYQFNIVNMLVFNYLLCIYHY